MPESDIKSVLESSKINKATKKSLKQLGRKSDNKYELIEKETSNLKNEYNKRPLNQKLAFKKRRKHVYNKIYNYKLTG